MTLPYEIVILDVGGSPLVYPWSRAGQADPELVGGISRAYAGNQYTSIAAEFDVIPLVSQHRTSAEYGAVKTLFAKGAQVVCQGKVFNPRVADLITCSGKVTGEMEPGFVGDDGEPLWTISLTLTEADNNDTQPTALATIYLSNATSPLDGAALLATADVDASTPAGPGAEILLDGVTIPTCGVAPCAIVTSPSAERVWLLDGAEADGWITGSPTVQLSSSGDSGGNWVLQDCMCKIFIVRSGSDVAEWDTAWSAGNGGFSGDNITMAAPAVVFPGLTGDRVRVELYGRGQRQPGTSSTSLQTVFFGGSFPNTQAGLLRLGGDAATLLWPAP